MFDFPLPRLVSSYGLELYKRSLVFGTSVQGFTWNNPVQVLMEFVFLSVLPLQCTVLSSLARGCTNE